MDEQSAMTVKLTYKDKVPVVVMKNILTKAIYETFGSPSNETNPAVYDGEKCNEMAKTLAGVIRNQLRDLNYDRYKYLVQVMIGERREQGVRSGCRTFWDTNTDSHVTENFINDNIFCVASAYAIYLY